MSAMKKKFKGRKVQTECQAWVMAVFRRSHAIEELPDTIVEAVRCTKMESATMA